jgi:tetratricopeptide (TPR) repeat protein
MASAAVKGVVPAEPHTASLSVLTGPAAGSDLHVGREIRIGRHEAPDGRLGGDPSLSRHHAAIRYGPDGALTIEDLGSTNGTHVNQQRIAAPRELSEGDSVQVGETMLRVTNADGDASRPRTVVPRVSAAVLDRAEPSLTDARRLQAVGDRDGALRTYASLIACGRDLAAAYHGAGYIHFKNQDFAEADRMLGESLRIQPRNANALYIRAQICAVTGDAGQAADLYREALVVNPSHGPARAALGLGDGGTASTPTTPAASDRTNGDEPSDAPTDSRVAEYLGVYEFLLQDKSPLSRHAVALINALHITARPRFIAYLGRRPKHPSRSPLRSVVIAIGGLAWLAWMIYLVGGASDGQSKLAHAHIRIEPSQIASLMAISIGLGAMVVCLCGIRIATTRYTLARGRVQIEAGLFARSARNVELWRVERVDLHQSLINRLTGDGTLVFAVRGEDRPLLITGLVRLPALETLRQQLMNLVFALRSNPMVKGIIQ